MHSLDQLKTSISNLWDEFGKTDNFAVGLLVNCSLAAVGVVGYLLASGWLQFAAAVWAILNIAPVLLWVIRG